MSEYQWKVGTDDAAWAQRFEAARDQGRVTNVSGLGKLAFSHAADHGQAATEALLRTSGPVDQDQGADWMVSRVLIQLVEQLVADGAEDVKRWVLQCTAVVVLVLLAVGTALYLRPSTGTA